MNTEMTRETIARLEVLAASPVAAQALAELEGERTRKRADALRRLADGQAQARAECDACVPEVVATAANVKRLQGELLAARIAVAEAERREFYASHALEQCARTAEVALGPLGGDVIEDALRRVFAAQREERGLMEWREIMSWDGRIADVRTVSDEPAQRLQWLKELQGELEALRLDPMAPADIERRCAEIHDAIERREVPRPKAEARKSGIGAFFWGRLAKARGTVGYP